MVGGPQNNVVVAFRSSDSIMCVEGEQTDGAISYYQIQAAAHVEFQQESKPNQELKQAAQNQQALKRLKCEYNFYSIAL